MEWEGSPIENVWGCNFVWFLRVRRHKTSFLSYPANGCRKSPGLQGKGGGGVRWPTGHRAPPGALVRPGGTVVYSTCTIDPLENEGVVGRRLLPLCHWSSPQPHLVGFSPDQAFVDVIYLSFWYFPANKF